MPTDRILVLEKVHFGWDSMHDLVAIETFSIEHGESVFLHGPSGSGKSTLLGLIGGVIVPRAGKVLLNDVDLVSQRPARRDQMRADYLGIIFQQFNLLPYLSVVENIALPCQFSKHRLKRSQEHYGTPRQEAVELARRLGLPTDILGKPINQLSVGQQQRAAVARALIGGPSLVIADEPTSALDSDNRDKFIELLNEQRQTFNTGLLFVSHDAALASHFDRVVEFEQLNSREQASGRV